MNPAPPCIINEIAEQSELIEQVDLQNFYCVYVLRSTKDNILYIGCTANLFSRVATHQAGKARGTQGKGPWELIYVEAFRHQLDAYQRERQLKQFGGSYRQLKRRLAHELNASASSGSLGQGGAG